MRSWRGHVAGLGLVVLLALIGLVGAAQATEDLETAQPRASATVGELAAGAAAGQTFEAKHGGLAEVAVKLGTYDRRNRGTLTFRLEGPGMPEAITQTVAMARLEDNAYEVFELPAVRDSAGRRFTFTLEAGSDAERGNAVTVWGATADVYSDGQAVLTRLGDGKGVRDLTFRVGYDPPLLARVDLFVERLAAGKPSVWGDRRLYVMLGGTYAVLLYALVVMTVGKEDGVGSRE